MTIYIPLPRIFVLHLVSGNRCFVLGETTQYQIVICKLRKLSCKKEMQFLTKKSRSHLFFVFFGKLIPNMRQEKAYLWAVQFCLTDLKAVTELLCYNFPCRQAGSLCHCFSPRNQIIPFLLQYF